MTHSNASFKELFKYINCDCLYLFAIFKDAISNSLSCSIAYSSKNMRKGTESASMNLSSGVEKTIIVFWFLTSALFFQTIVPAFVIVFWFTLLLLLYSGSLPPPNGSYKVQSWLSLPCAIQRMNKVRRGSEKAIEFYLVTCTIRIQNNALLRNFSSQA